jgi:hypothetical protein
LIFFTIKASDAPSSYFKRSLYFHIFVPNFVFMLTNKILLMTFSNSCFLGGADIFPSPPPQKNIANGQAILFGDCPPSEQLQSSWLRMYGALLSFPHKSLWNGQGITL